MDKISSLKNKRLIFALLAAVLLVLTIVFAIVSFKLVAQSKYSTMWYFLVASAITLYAAVFFGIACVNHNLYIKVVSAVINEGTDDSAALEGVLGIKAKALKKIINKCKKRSYIA